MEQAKPRFEKYILVCENQRETGDCCGVPGERVRALLKEKVQKLGLNRRIRVSRTGCLDECSEGPNVLIVPDYIWFKHVREDDVDKIIQSVANDLTPL